MRTRPRPAAALAIVVLIAAGCGGSPADDGGAESQVATDRSRAMRFAECMRDNGISEFPDPEASGQLTIDGVVNGSSLDTSAPAWESAIAACKDLEPPGFTGVKRGADEQDRALQFAQCIRDNGVEDFPDPSPGDPLVDTRRIPSAATSEGMSILNAAMQECRDLGPEVAGGRP